MNHFGSQRIEFLWTIESNGGDVVLDAVQDEVSCGGFGHGLFIPANDQVNVVDSNCR